MNAQDKKQIEKANARNAVEEYVYEMKDKLEEDYKEYITEQVSARVFWITEIISLNIKSMLVCTTHMYTHARVREHTHTHVCPQACTHRLDVVLKIHIMQCRT